MPQLLIHVPHACNSADLQRHDRRIKASAEELCSGRLVLVHEGGYSEVYVPFCGHATISTLANSTIVAPDPFAETFAKRQPRGKFADFIHSWVDDLAAFHRC